MSEQDFKDQFKVIFLATWAATHYTDYCMNSQQEQLSNPPVEDAVFLADEAWKKLQSI
jgi:hypothetical protein